MPTKPEQQPVIRHHDRFACRFVASVAVEEASAPQVALSRTAAGADGRVRATVVDCSDGGIGVHLGVLLPRTCPVELLVQLPDDPGNERPLRLRARVKRVCMISRRPEYYVGAAFITDDHGADARIARLIEAARASGNAIEGEPAGA